MEQESLKVPAIVTATCSMPVVFATAQEKSMSADVQTSLKATATVKGTNLTPLGYVEALVQLM